MNPFGRMHRMTGGVDGKGKTSQLNPFRGAPLGAIQPQYHLPELPQYDLPDLRGRRGRHGLVEKGQRSGT